MDGQKYSHNSMKNCLYKKNKKNSSRKKGRGNRVNVISKYEILTLTILSRSFFKNVFALCSVSGKARMFTTIYFERYFKDKFSIIK